jgi:Ca2+/Na+ antiporter
VSSNPMNGRQSDAGGFPALTDGEMLAMVQAKSRRLDRQIRLRDWRETIAATLGVLLIAPMAIHASPLKRVGVGIVIAALVFIVVTLIRGRREQRVPVDTAVTTALLAERARIDSQIKLLESVLAWYISPLAVGTLVMVIGDRPPWWVTAAYAAILALLSWCILQLNTRAVRNYLRPRRDEVTALLSRLESAADVTR